MARLFPLIFIGLSATFVAGLLTGQVLVAIAAGGLLIFLFLLAKIEDFPVGFYLLAVAFATIATPIFRGLLFLDILIILLILANLRRFWSTLPPKILNDPIVFGVALYLLSAFVGDALNGFFAGIELYFDIFRWGISLLFYLYARSQFVSGNKRLLNVLAAGFATVVLLSTSVSIYEAMVGQVYDFRVFFTAGDREFVRFELSAFSSLLRPAGLFNNANMTSVQMAFFMPWCMTGLMESKTNRPLKLFYFISIAAGFVSVILTASRGGILTLLIVVIAFFMLSRKKNVLLGWGLLAMIGFVLLSYTGFIRDIPFNPIAQIEQRFSQIGIEDFNTTSRIELNQLALKFWIENPVFGIGMGRFNELIFLREDVSPKLRQMLDIKGSGIANHNSYTQFLAEAGLVGTLGILYALLKGLNSLRQLLTLHPVDHETYSWSVAIAVSVLAILLGSLTGDFIPQRNIWFIFGIASGLVVALSPKSMPAKNDLEEGALAYRIHGVQ